MIKDLPKNREIYEKDPTENKLLNQGVVKISSGQTDAEKDTLRFELTNFVCDGQYAHGLTRILSAYLSHLHNNEQPGVWVSGFFGSGKSHLVKMLQNLWIDYEFADHAKARGLARVPTNIAEHLVELTNYGRKAGGLHAAAGTLGISAADKSLRLELLGIIFKSVGLPEHFHTARFVLFLRQEGIEQAVQDHVVAAKRDFDFELANLYVSDPIAKAILAANPGFAANPGEVKRLLEAQYAEKSDVSMDDMIATIKLALSRNNKLPLTLIVLDEVQQYIGDSIDRSKAVQDVQEQLCSRLGSNIMFVATGQNALAGTAHLQRLQGRFPVTVELQDTDVEKVTREVVLKKKPTAEPIVKDELDDHSGEIERHLANTKIAFNSRDRGLLVQDYPLLPSRRRFWEHVLRAVDKAGTGAQLRTQLWMVYDAVERTANLPLGNVVSAAFVFEHIEARVRMSGVMLLGISETIAKQTKEVDGVLRRQLCALIFLIGQLPHEGPDDAGIRADADTLADLLVTDLNAGSSDLRKKIPELLDLLAAEGSIMQIENEYRMQTPEGSEWNQAFQEANNKIINDTGKLAGERAALLRSHCSDMLAKRTVQHGISKVPRKYDLHFGAEPPKTDGPNIPVWIRDGWDVNDKTVLADARAAGDSAAIVFCFIAKKHEAELRRTIASFYAASTTVQARSNPSTPEGMEAKRAMETRRDLAERARNVIISDILNETAVYIAGGDSFPGITLEAKVQDAATACLDRLYEKFNEADSPDWHKVIDRAKKGDGDAMAAVGHKGDPDSHPVCSAILSFVGSGKKGTEIRKQFMAPKYGWPQDAIDAALMVLHRAGLILARNGSDLLAKDKLDQKNITTLDFRVEDQPLSKIQLIELRKMLAEIGIPTQVGQESAKTTAMLTDLINLANTSGGDAPRPARPDTLPLSDLLNRVGNDQLKAAWEQRATLKQHAVDWKHRAEVIARRDPQWRTLKELLMHAGELPVFTKIKAEVDAIEADRKLLADPDPVPGLCKDLTQALREALNQLHADCKQRFDHGNAALAASATWSKVKPADRVRLLAQHQIGDVATSSVGTTTEVLDTLRHTRIKEWKNLRDALPTRFEHALQDAAKLLQPKAQYLKLNTATITAEAELKDWLTAAEQQIKSKLGEGPVIV